MGLEFHSLLYLKNMCQRAMKNRNKLGFVAAEQFGLSWYRGIVGHEGSDTRMGSRRPRNGR